MLSVIFDGHELNEYLGVTSDFERGIGTTRKNDLLQVGNSDGSKYRGYRLESNYFPMPFVVLYELSEKRRRIAEILNVSEPRKLVFGDEPDVFYWAVPTGKVGLSEKNFLGKGEIEWTIPDGVAHSTQEKEFTFEDAKTETVTSDFLGKVENSNIENGNGLKLFHLETLATPSQSGGDAAQVYIDSISKLDGSPYVVSTPTGKVGLIAQSLISFDIVNYVERNYPELFRNANTIAEKVAVVKNKVTTFTVNVYAKGSGPSGNKVTLQNFGQAGNWVGGSTNVTGNISKLKLSSQMKFFIANDGCIHSIVYAEKSNEAVASSHTIDYADIEFTVLAPATNFITVENEGTYKTYARIEAEMKSDNGVLAIINEDGGILQIGNPDEIDGLPYKQQETVIDERWSGTSLPAGWEVNKGKVRYTTYVANGQLNLQNGLWNYTQDKDAVVPSYVGNDTPVWAGPTLHTNIKRNSNNSNTANFSFKNRFMFDVLDRTTGRIEINLQNEDDIPFSIVLRDSSKTSSEIRYEIWIQGTRYIDKALDKNKFKSGFFQVEINRLGNRIEFKIIEIKSISDETVTGSAVEMQAYYVDAAESIPITSLTLWSHRFQNESWTYFRLTDTKFTWLNVDNWNDLANTFAAGDILTIDTASASIFVNGVLSTTLGALGNEWDKFELPPGPNKIYLSVSSWAQMPDAKVVIREAYL